MKITKFISIFIIFTGIAPSKLPHNDTVMCEKCHGSYLHDLRFIQPDGSLGLNKSTSATCTDCHYSGVPGYTAPVIPDFKHSSKINNGSVWGSYWTSDRSDSCEYCHSDTKHDKIASGRLKNLTDFLENGYGDIVCESCHHINGTYSSTSANYVHSIDEISGDECIAYHGTNY